MVCCECRVVRPLAKHALEPTVHVSLVVLVRAVVRERAVAAEKRERHDMVKFDASFSPSHFSIRRQGRVHLYLWPRLYCSCVTVEAPELPCTERALNSLEPITSALANSW